MKKFALALAALLPMSVFAADHKCEFLNNEFNLVGEVSLTENADKTYKVSATLQGETRTLGESIEALEGNEVEMIDRSYEWYAAAHEGTAPVSRDQVKRIKGLRTEGDQQEMSYLVLMSENGDVLDQLVITDAITFTCKIPTKR